MVVSPQNQPLQGTLTIIKWHNAWCAHYNSNQPDLLDHQYPVVIAYNGIHHYTPTEFTSGNDKDKAIYKVMARLFGDLSNLTEGIVNKENREGISNILTLCQREVGNLRTDPSAKFAVPAPPTSFGSSAPPAPPVPAAVPGSGNKYKYKCEKCSKTFQRSNELQNHDISAHGEGFQCDQCDHTPFNSKTALNVHLKTKHGMGKSATYACSQCDYTSNRKDAVLAHEVRKHNKVVPEADKKVCPNEGCQSKFITQEQLNTHLRLICQKGADIPCQHQDCDKKFKNKQQMLAHFVVHTDEAKKWFCEECQKQLKSKQSFNNHMQMHK